MNATYLIPECNLAELEARVAKLNKRAKRLGVPEITLAKSVDHVKHQVRQLQSGCEIGGPMTRLVWRKSVEKDPNPTAFLANAFEPTGVVMAWWKVEVTGETPKLAGWSFVAVLTPLTTDDGQSENFVRNLPGETCPVEFRGRVGECDHCKTKRRRTETFVVRKAVKSDEYGIPTESEHKMVGRQCIKDFLGYNGDPHQLAEWAETIAQLGELCMSAGDEDWLGCGGRGRSEGWDLKHFLTLTATAVRNFGWLSRTKARDAEGWEHKEATADKVLRFLNPPRPEFQTKEDMDFQATMRAGAGEDSAKAEASIEWARELSPRDDEDYLLNVRLVARTGYASRKTAGVAASILAAHAKAMEQEIKRQRDAARPESNWVGEVGQRIKGPMLVRCERVIANEGEWGVTGIHKMTDEAGNDLVWFASGSATWLKEGQQAYVSATVKDHGEYKGRKQTVLTRVTTWTEQGVEEWKTKEAKKAVRSAKKATK